MSSTTPMHAIEVQIEMRSWIILLWAALVLAAFTIVLRMDFVTALFAVLAVGAAYAVRDALRLSREHAFERTSERAR